MEEFKNFLESSTIHGLTYISTTRTLVRLFWIVVVILGFSTASLLIYQSFQAWEESPVSTTIETLPISKITFPKVTVCPPKETYTDLNYDLMMLEGKTLDDDTRRMLKNYAVQLLYDHLHESILKNLSLLQDEERYHNWYHGYTMVTLPSQEKVTGENYGITYWFTTFDASGTVRTAGFGEKFDADKVPTDIKYVISISPPENIRESSDVTLHVETEKVSMAESGSDKFFVEQALINANIQNYTKQFSPPQYAKEVKLQRQVTREDVANMDMELMPGFKVKWFYSGQDVESQAYYTSSDSNDQNTRLFIRHYSIISYNLYNCVTKYFVTNYCKMTSQ